jgi:hypothetical protein
MSSHSQECFGRLIRNRHTWRWDEVMRLLHAELSLNWRDLQPPDDYKGCLLSNRPDPISDRPMFVLEWYKETDE